MPSFKTLTKKVQKLNSHYMVPTSDNTRVISDPEQVKRDQLHKMCQQWHHIQIQITATK